MIACILSAYRTNWLIAYNLKKMITLNYLRSVSYLQRLRMGLMMRGSYVIAVLITENDGANANRIALRPCRRRDCVLATQRVKQNSSAILAMRSTTVYSEARRFVSD